MTATTRRRCMTTLLIALVALAVVSDVSLAAFGDITFVSQLTLPNTNRITDVWGYHDSATGKDYAVIGDWFTGVHIVDVSNPGSPSYVTKVTGVPGFDVKVYDHYVYTCDGNASGNDSRIIDISNISSPSVLTTTFESCHNIAISDNGTMFLEYLGLRAYDLSADPESPNFLWANVSNGHDSTPDGNYLYDFTGWDGTMNIWDVTNPAAPVLAGTITDPAINYYHSGDASKDGNYLYICDEIATDPQPDIIVYNISNLSLPSRVGDLAEPTATIHNLYVIGDLAFIAHYTAGFRTLDLTNPASPVVADTYDTSGFTGEGYDGAFGVYPYASSGLIYISDDPNGLYIFSVDGYNGPPTAVGGTPSVARLGQNFPNPFNPTTTISYELGDRTDVTLEVFDVRGAIVRTLVQRSQPAGSYRVDWNGTNDGGQAVASGVYHYRLRGGGNDLTRKMVLLK